MFQVIVAWDCIGYRGKMGGWGGGGGVGGGVYLPGILTFHKFEIFYNHGWIYRFQREFNKNYEERWSPNNFMQSLSVHCFLMSKKVFLYTFNPRLLNSFDLPSYGSELRKRYTLRLFLMCLEEKSFGSCSAWGNGGQTTHLGRKVCLMSFIKDDSEVSVDNSCALPTACFLDTMYWIELQKMHISEYVCKSVLKNQPFTWANPWKNIAVSKISKNPALTFLRYFKNKYFPEHFSMETSVNVTKYVAVHNM